MTGNVEYSKEVMKNFFNPKNMGEIKNPSGVGEVGNARCGDVMKVFIKVVKKDGNEILKDVKFKTFGCVAAIASSSMVTQLTKGKTLEEVKKVKMKDVEEALKGLPKIKLHCASMAIQGLGKAIKEYEGKN